MHSEKIWGMDLDSADSKYLITGGGDSAIKVWTDCTVTKVLEEKA